VLVNPWHWRTFAYDIAISGKIKDKTIFSLLFSFLSLPLCLTPVMAAGETIGVVKSQENTRQWSEITNRLQQVGVDYCIVDTSYWERELDLGNIGVLVLPNVETLTGGQAQALQQWMGRGGKVIVTGPTGNLSQPIVRSQLRSLFGAYWGFPLSAPTTLQLSEATPPEWSGRSQLSQTFKGAAVIPSTSNSQTAAIWLAEGSPPAAIVTENSTVLGWRWGIDAVSSPSVDVAWLQAALNRYGISTYGRFVPTSYKEPTSCRPNTLPGNETRPLLPHWQLENPAPLPQSRFNFPDGANLTPAELESMSREIEGLIARFESTLLTADANNSEINSSTGQVVEQLLTNRVEGNKSQLHSSLSDLHSVPTKKANSVNGNARQALKEAREKLTKFQLLVEQRDYIQARRQWLEARRILWDNYPTDRQLAQSEIRAMWLDRGTIVKARSESDLAAIFDRMAKAGINTVFFETVNAGYSIYPSRVAPQQNPLIRGWDPLKVAVKLAHERGMELHAWVWTFAAANQRHNIILNLPINNLGPVLSRYPDWAMSDREGNLFHYNSGKVFFDPANPGVRRYLSLLLEEIATQYDVDGIQLDYIRYPFQSGNGTKTYGYGIAARQQFEQVTGVDPTTLTLSNPLWSQWTGFRIKQVDSFVESVSNQLRQKRSDLVLSTAVFPIVRHQRLSLIQQNWEEWIRQGWIDMLVPMTYAMDTQELQQLTSPLLSQSTEGNALLLPGIRLLNLPDVVAIDQMQLLRGMPTEGFALFAAENFNSNLEKIFSRTQGNLSSDPKEPLPHRQPFQATLSRYQTLQKEWNFLLSNNQISLDETTLREWGQQADELASALEQLAGEPSTKNLLSAKLALSSFRRQFPRWTEEINAVQSYQAQVWQNRLTTLDNLLSYGEKRVFKQGQSRLN
jgi:uncharacterized lipoprotein YddW (UPF0748 family)